MLHEYFLCPPGDLESFKKNTFVIKEGVEYRIKINFKVREFRVLPMRIPVFVVSDLWRRDVTAAAGSYLCHGEQLSRM